MSLDSANPDTVHVNVTVAEARPLVVGRIYTDTQERAAFRLVATEDRPDGRVELWFERVAHCPAGLHRDKLALPA